MASEHTEGAEQATSSSSAAGWVGLIEERYKKMKDHAETYPYVWASYAVVYGGFGLWFTYRWRRLRRTEDRVRALQRRLRALVEADEATSSSIASADNSSPNSVDKHIK